MSGIIRTMCEADRERVLAMMRTFYASPAVLSNGSEEIFRCDIDACVQHSPYLEGYVFEDAGQIQGYAMVAKSFSTEFGKPCMWLEDLYVDEASRGHGWGNRFLTFLIEKYPDCVLRLEAEDENERAIQLYEKHGFSVLPYLELKR